MKTITIEEFKKLKRRSAHRELEDRFAAAWEDYVKESEAWDITLHRAVPQHPFMGRPFDFAWPANKIAVEIQGGTFSGGAHVRGPGYQRDVDKRNAATLAGWKVLYFTSTDIRRRIRRCCQMVGELL